MTTRRRTEFVRISPVEEDGHVRRVARDRGDINAPVPIKIGARDAAGVLWCRANDVCQGYPDYASFDPNGLCCGTTPTTPRPTFLRGTTPPTDAGECLACHACGGSADCPATSYCRGNGVCQGFPDYSSFDPRGECCARP